MLTLKKLSRRLIKLNLGFERSNLTQLNDISKGDRVVKSTILQFYSANRNIGNYTPVLGIHQMLDQELDVWNIHKSPVDWEFVHKNYTQVIVGGAGLLHSVFEKFWVDLDKNCKLPITIWGIGVCLPDNDSVKGVPKAVVQSVFAKAKLANVRDELTRDFYQLDPKITAFHKLYGGGVCITDINQLPAALASEKFKEKSNYHLELDRVREFGASFR